MSGLHTLYGTHPRVRALEAILELMPREFTASYAAGIAGETGRTSFNEALRELAEEGFLTFREEGGRRYYKAIPDHPLLEIASVSDAAIAILSEEMENREFLTAFQARARAIVERAEDARTTTSNNVSGFGQTIIIEVPFA